MKIPQAACSVSKTYVEISTYVIEDNVKEHKKKKRSKNRRVNKLTSGETSKTEERKADIGPDNTHKEEHTKEESLEHMKSNFRMKKKKELFSLSFCSKPNE